MDILSNVSKDIVELINPIKVILFSQKTSQQGDITSFKLCVIVDSDEKTAVERHIYLNIDCDIPFDIIVYTPKEWDNLKDHEHTFAYTLNLRGRVLYER